MPDGIAQRMSNRTRGLVARLWRGYAPIILLIAVYYGAASLLLGEYDADIPIELVQTVLNMKLMSIAFAITGILFAYASLVRKTDDSAMVRIRRWVANQPFIEIGLLRFLPVALLMVPFQEIYVVVKIHIPDIVPYSWDAVLAGVDRLIFMGIDPWKLTHWLLPWPFVTWVVNVAYILWFYLLMACVTAAAVLPLDSRVRLTYLLACFLSWAVGGSVIAVIFSSAGPVYYERLFGDPVFRPLFERLATQDAIYTLISLSTQEHLWRGYADPAVPAVGISAFPSMHLCIAAGMSLFAFRLARPAGWLLVAFTAVMLVGSVHLGWHYAIDGIAGIALAVVFWRISERFSCWWFERSAMSPEPAGVFTEGSPHSPAT